ncbi:MAG: GHKL domain-containing protein [Bacteroidetes bacterium]|nr:MAG: GHKL domain-containing protein [Bacteroidota bacterium]
MRFPEKLAHKRLFLRNYLLFTLVLTGLQFSLLYFRYGHDVLLAFTDAFVSVILLNTLLLGLGFVVRYARNQKVDSFFSIRNSVAAGLLIVITWLFFSSIILQSVFYHKQDYLEFLAQSREIRFAAGLFVASLVYLAFFLGVYQHSVKEALIRENELRTLVETTELQALRNQLNPHFIYNSLNSISSLTVYSPEKAREMLGLLSEFLRIALKKDTMQLTNFSEELQNIELYLKIEKVRFEDKLEWEILNSAEFAACQIPALVLQPLFENAVKHGVQQSSQKGVVRLTCKMVEDDLLLTLTNKYDQQFQRFKGEGVGLENVRNRMRLIYQRTGLLKVEAQEGVFVCNLTVPQKK